MDRRSILVLRLVVPLAAAAVLAEIAYPLADADGRRVLSIVTVVVFAAASVTHAAVTRGRSAVTLLVCVCGFGGLAAEAVGLATDIPFGAYDYTDALGPRVLGVPLVVPAAWLMMAWPAYLVGARLGRRSGGFTQALIATWALASWDLFLDPQMVDAGYWRWDDPTPSLPGVDAVPLTNYGGWLVVSFAMMSTLGAALRRARRPDSDPPSGSSPDTIVYALYLWTWASSVLAHAAFFDLRGSAVAGGIGMGLIALPLLHSLSRRGVRTS